MSRRLCNDDKLIINNECVEVSVQGVSDATGDRYARLLGTGNGLQKFLVSNQDSFSPHPVLRYAK